MEIMPSSRNHSLVTAYAILFTTAAGIVGYDLCTHRPHPLPDLPTAAGRMQPPKPAAPAPIAALDSRKPDTAQAAKPARAGVL